jgi:hypothetical protein
VPHRDFRIRSTRSFVFNVNAVPNKPTFSTLNPPVIYISLPVFHKSQTELESKHIILFRKLTLTGGMRTRRQSPQNMATRQSNTHSNLLSLSNELLINIIEFASITAGSSWLLDLCTCSRRLHNITEPILYTRIEEGGIFGKSLPKLLCRIVERPDLGRRVKIWGGDPMDSAEEEESVHRWVDTSTVEETDWERIQGIVDQIELNGSHTQSWFETMQGGSWDAMTALVLYLLPNLRELKFSGWNPWDSDDWTEVYKHGYPIGSFSDFSRLKTLTITTSILLDNRVAPSEPLSIDCLPPSLESLTVEDFDSAFASQVCELVSQKRFLTPNLKYLDLGWEGTFDPVRPKSRVRSHPGFSNITEAKKFAEKCKEAGIELQRKYLPQKSIRFYMG